MPGYTRWRVKDPDGRWWEFDQQNRGYSCGPTSAKIAKMLYHNKPLAEAAVRGRIGLDYAGQLNQDVSLTDGDTMSAQRWTGVGTYETKVLAAMVAQPLAIPGARFVREKPAEHLRRTSRNHPAVLGFNWAGGGGHFVVCVGPLKSGPPRFLVLDPDGGLQYLNAADFSGDSFKYRPAYGGEGIIDPIGFIVTY